MIPYRQPKRAKLSVLETFGRLSVNPMSLHTLMTWIVDTFHQLYLESSGMWLEIEGESQSLCLHPICKILD